ncbi:MAG: helicase-related protein [Xenococcus sp. (in: cyanobacteria)]
MYKAVELESKEKKEYNKKFKELLADYRRRVKEGKVKGDAEALVTLNYMRKLNSEFKVPTAIKLMEELLEQGQQVVVFTEFVESAKALYKEFEEISKLLIGETKNRQGAVDRFQNGESKVFVGTIKAGGVGITLTAASNVILIDRPWTPGDTEQAEDRCYRIGQDNAVFVSWLRLGIVDESIDNLLTEKQRNIDLALAGKNKAQTKTKSAKEFAEELLENL